MFHVCTLRPSNWLAYAHFNAGLANLTPLVLCYVCISSKVEYFGKEHGLYRGFLAIYA